MYYLTHSPTQFSRRFNLTIPEVRVRRHCTHTQLFFLGTIVILSLKFSVVPPPSKTIKKHIFSAFLTFRVYYYSYLLLKLILHSFHHVFAASRSLHATDCDCHATKRLWTTNLGVMP